MSTIKAAKQKTVLYKGSDLYWALGGIICNFTLIFPYFQHWEDEPRPQSFSGKQIKWRPKKKGLHQNWKTFPRIQLKTKKKKKGLHQKNWKTFFHRIQVKTSAQMQTRVIWLGGGGCRCRPYSNYWGDTLPISPGFGTPGIVHYC